MIGRVLLLGGAVVAGLGVVLVAGIASAVAAGRSAGVSTAGIADIPAPMLALYQRAAATCPGLDWAVLAAVGKVETDHGRSTLPGVAPGTVNSAGAGVICRSALAMRHVSQAADTPRAGEVSAGSKP